MHHITACHALWNLFLEFKLIYNYRDINYLRKGYITSTFINKNINTVVQLRRD